MMMPRLVLVCALAGCGFDADYRGGQYRCSDGVCPTSLRCVDEVCVDPSTLDAAVPDASPDASPDAMTARTCADPGELDRGAPVEASGDTTGGLNHVSAMCSAAVQNAPDDVFRLTAQAGDALDVAITGDAVVRAYVVTTCVAPPSTPSCVGGTAASPGNPIALTGLAAGDVYVVVDGENAALGGSYTVTVHLR